MDKKGRIKGEKRVKVEGGIMGKGGKMVRAKGWKRG